MPFSKNDIVCALKDWESKLKEVEYLGKYSLKHRKESLKERLERYKEFTEKLLEDEKELLDYLKSLNDGTYKFSPFKVFYVANPYFGKMRLTLQVPFEESKGEKVPKGFKDILTIKLLSKALKNRWFRDVAYNVRDRVIGDLLKTLKRANEQEEYVILRGDFRNYTLNIPRKRLLELLKGRIEEPAVVKLVENYLTTPNQVSAKFHSLGRLDKFFSSHYGDAFEKDSDFKAMTNTDGVVPGTPLSTALGWIFLHRFDRFVKEELLKGKGFYARFLDDFIIVVPKERYGDFEKRIRGFLSEHYGVSEDWVKENLVKLEKPRRTSEDTEFDFLGYLFRFKKGKLDKTSVRYKTIKKFLYKYLYEYSFDRYRRKFPQISCQECDDECLKLIKNYLTAKAVYLNQWLLSFIHINDKKLLDDLFRFYILPNLYKEAKRFKKICPQLNVEKFVREIRNFFKPTLIHRQLVKRPKDKPLKEFLKERFQKVEEEIAKAVEKHFKSHQREVQN